MIGKYFQESSSVTGRCHILCDNLVRMFCLLPFFMALSSSLRILALPWYFRHLTTSSNLVFARIFCGLWSPVKIKSNINGDWTKKNGTVRGFGEYGIYSATPSHNNRVMNVSALANGNRGIYHSGSNSHIRGCTVNDNGGAGTGSGSVVTNNTTNHIR